MAAARMSAAARPASARSTSSSRPSSAGSTRVTCSPSGSPKPVTEAPLNQYTADLVEGVVAHWTDINELLATYSPGLDAGADAQRRPGHPAARAPSRCSTPTDVPEGVAITEAVELAKSLSTDDSPKFVNGLLGRLAEVKPTLA